MSIELFKARRTLISVLQLYRKGYKIPEQISTISYTSYKDEKVSLDVYGLIKDDNDVDTSLIFVDDMKDLSSKFEKIGSGDSDGTENYNNIHVIYVFLDLKECRSFKNKIDKQAYNHNLEIFKADELTVDKMNHKYVPKHFLLTVEEKNQEVESSMIEKMPRISLYDPVNKYFHGNIGDIYRIERPGGDICYRKVVKINIIKK